MFGSLADPLPTASFSQLRCPVKDDVHKCRVILVFVHVDQKVLSIGRGIVSEELLPSNRFMRPGYEQCLGCGEFELFAHFHRNPHQLSVPRKKEQFFPVLSPSWLLPSVDRDLVFSFFPWKVRDIPFPTARLVGGICHPAAVW